MPLGKSLLENITDMNFREYIERAGGYVQTVERAGGYVQTDERAKLPKDIQWSCMVPAKLRQEFATGKAFKEDIEATKRGDYRSLAHLTVGCLGVGLQADVCSPGFFSVEGEDFLAGTYYFYGMVDVGNGDWEWMDLGYAEDLLVFHTDCDTRDLDLDWSKNADLCEANIEWLAPDWKGQLFTAMLTSLIALVNRQKTLSFHKIAPSNWLDGR